MAIPFLLEPWWEHSNWISVVHPRDLRGLEKQRHRKILQKQSQNRLAFTKYLYVAWTMSILFRRSRAVKWIWSFAMKQQIFMSVLKESTVPFSSLILHPVVNLGYCFVGLQPSIKSLSQCTVFSIGIASTSSPSPNRNTKISFPEGFRRILDANLLLQNPLFWNLLEAFQLRF